MSEIRHTFRGIVLPPSAYDKTKGFYNLKTRKQTKDILQVGHKSLDVGTLIGQEGSGPYIYAPTSDYISEFMVENHIECGSIPRTPPQQPASTLLMPQYTPQPGSLPQPPTLSVAGKGFQPFKSTKPPVAMPPVPSFGGKKDIPSAVPAKLVIASRVGGVVPTMTSEPPKPIKSDPFDVEFTPQLLIDSLSSFKFEGLSGKGRILNITSKTRATMLIAIPSLAPDGSKRFHSSDSRGILTVITVQLIPSLATETPLKDQRIVHYVLHGMTTEGYLLAEIYSDSTMTTQFSELSTTFLPGRLESLPTPSRVPV